MPGASDADRAWKGMARSIAARKDQNAAAQPDAGKAAYDALMGPGEGLPADVRPWLLLRERTAGPDSKNPPRRRLAGRRRGGRSGLPSTFLTDDQEKRQG